MATLDQLKTRIILEIDRDDLGPGGESEQALADAISDAIDHHASEEFWFNRAIGSGTTATGTAAMPMPAGLRFAHQLALGGEALLKVPLAEIRHRTETGRPSHWAENGQDIQLWPVPDGAYAIAAFGLAATGVPATGADANIWTIEAAKLIVARAKATLMRMFKEYDAMQAAQAEEAEALARLRSDTRRRASSPMRTDLSAGGPAFDILRG